jgi:hypothetical protein
VDLAVGEVDVIVAIADFFEHREVIAELGAALLEIRGARVRAHRDPALVWR